MRQMRVLTGITTRELIKEANSLMIELKDVVSIIYRDGEFVMFYYQ